MTLAILLTACGTTATTGKFPRFANEYPPKSALQALQRGDNPTIAHRLAIVNYAKRAMKVQRKRDCAARIWNHENAKDCFK